MLFPRPAARMAGDSNPSESSGCAHLTGIANPHHRRPSSPEGPDLDRSTTLFTAGLALASLLAPGSTCAAMQVIGLAPPGTRIGFTIYAMGLFPLDGHYDRFAGAVRVDPAHPAECTVALDVEVGSLVMEDARQVRLALGPSLLDQAAYPHLLYRGSCAGGRATGLLTLHGVSRRLDLATARDGAVVTARGSLHRQDFGIMGLPGLIGARIAITFAVRLPEDVARLVGP